MEYVNEACESGQPGVKVRGRHVGFPSSLCSALGGLELDHNYLNGCRVGEASNPGPGSGGGARATARKRAEQEGEDDDPMDGGGGGLAAMLRPMLERMIKEIVMEILGAGGLKGMLAGMLVGEQPASSSSRAPRVAQTADDETPVVGQGKRWRQRQGLQDGAKSAADGPAKGKGKHTDEHAGPAKGKGKSAESDGASKGKGKGAENRHPKGRNKGADGDGESKGKGKAAGRAAGPLEEEEGSWEIVPGRQWTLRSGDWTDPS